MAKKQNDGGWASWEEEDIPPDIRSFNAFGKSAAIWLEQSKGLHYAAVALWEKSSSKSPKRPFDGPIALMLGGYAIETILKMVVISEYCDANGMSLTAREAKEFLPTKHDLRKLVTKAKLRTNAKDRDALDKLSEYIKWRGRYPIPLWADGYSGPAIFWALSEMQRPNLIRIWEEYIQLYKKLHRLAIRRTFQ